MPMPNTHALRLTDPKQYDEFRTFTPDGFPDGIYFILGVKDGKTEPQSLRGDASKVSFKELLDFAERNDMKPIEKERASSVKTDKEVLKSLKPDLFATWAEVQLCKGGDSEGRALIEGIISSDSVDQQGDRILQEGLDFSYFLSKGFLNDDHKSGAGNIVGQPIEVYHTTTPSGAKATAMKGYLYTNKARAKEIYDTAVALAKAKSDRKLGFSIEGQVLERDPMKPTIIKRAKVLHVAVTHQPVNPDTANLELIARSLGEGMSMNKTAQEIANHIMSMHPELAHKDVLMELLALIDNAHGYEGKDSEDKGYGAKGYGAKGDEYKDSEDKGSEDKGSEAEKSHAELEIEIEVNKKPEDEGDDSMEGEDSMDGEGSVEGEDMADPKQELINAVTHKLLGEFAKMAEKQMGDLMEPKAEKSAPMVSSSQLAWVLSNSFPNLSAQDAKKLATRLVAIARSRV
jgi:hypothetical protein